MKKKRITMSVIALCLIALMNFSTVYASSSVTATSGNSDAKIAGTAMIKKNGSKNYYTYCASLSGPYRDAASGPVDVTGPITKNYTLSKDCYNVPVVGGSTTKSQITISVKVNGFTKSTKKATVS